MKSIPYPLLGDWLITEEGKALIRQVYETAHATGRAERLTAALEARDGQPLTNEHQFEVRDDGIVVLTIDGPLMRKAELFSDISGATSYQWISARLDDCYEARTRKLVMRFTSPGGEAAGCGECGEKIARLIASGAHVEGYIETQAASACYWLASQCSHLTAHPTARAGWIGAVVSIFDRSEQNEKAGIREIEVVSEGAEDKRSLPVSKEVVARLQRHTDNWGRLFTEAVALGRGVSSEYVLENFGRGDGMFAEAALKVGLIDSIGNFESTIAGLTGARVINNSLPARAARVQGGTMPGPKEMLTAAAGSSGDEWKCAGCSQPMGPSAKAYCVHCAEPDEDDEDEDEAKALGLDPKATSALRRERMVALVEFEKYTLATLGADNVAGARGVLLAAHEAHAELPKIRKLFDDEVAAGIKRDLRTALTAGLEGKRLTLGRIQKSIPRVLRGVEVTAWEQAMASLKKIERETVLDAACSVPLGREAVTSIIGWVTKSEAIAAEPFTEPPRNSVAEEEDISALDETAKTVATAAAATRKHLDRGKAAKAK